MIEQLIFLLLTIAQGLTFVSFSIAILFAFFKKTEVIARSILDLWIELIVQTVVIALMQSLIVSFLLGAAATQNALVVLGVSLLCTIFILVLLWSGIKAVWNSFNRLFGAMGQVTGGVMVAPGAVGLGLAGAGAAAAVGGAALAANVGSSALAGVSAVQQGATASQTAGVMLGGSRRLAVRRAHAGVSARHAEYGVGPDGRRIHRRLRAAPGRAERAARGRHRRAGAGCAVTQRPRADSAPPELSPACRTGIWGMMRETRDSTPNRSASHGHLHTAG